MVAQTKFCTQCGTEITAADKFCYSCGKGVSSPDVMQSAELTDDSTADLERLLRDSTKGEYEIEGCLGRGGMAAVFRARDVSLDRPVAIKILPPELTFGAAIVERFRREARTAAQLNHPGIIPIHRIGQAGPTLYFVMKLVEGRTLEEIMQEVGPMEIGLVQSIVANICAPISYAHRRGVIHRDMKPSNVMIDDEGYTVVMDFGIAKAADNLQLTATGAALGTPYYMSTEQAGGKQVTAATDQYSVGIMTYQMITGELPFQGESAQAILAKHLFEEARPLGELRPDAPSPVRSAVHRAMAKKPEDRFPTIAEFSEALNIGVAEEDEDVRTKMVSLSQTDPGRPSEEIITPLSPIPKGRLSTKEHRSEEPPPKKSESQTAPPQSVPTDAPTFIIEAHTTPLPEEEAAAQTEPPAEESPAAAAPASGEEGSAPPTEAEISLPRVTPPAGPESPPVEAPPDEAATPATPLPSVSLPSPSEDHPAGDRRVKLAAGVVILLVAGAGIGVVATRTTERAEVAGPGLDERGSVPTESVPSDASEVGIPTAVPLAVTDTQRVAGPPTREETRRPEEPQAVTPPSGTPAPSERAAERQTGRAQPEPAPSEPAPSEAEAPRQAESRAPPPVPRIQVPEITVPTVDTVAGPEPAEEEPAEQPAQPEPPPARLQFVNPVDGLVVTINGERARLEDWTINLPPGTYRIVLSAPGYETRERELTLDPGAIQIMSASLRKQ